MLSPLASATLFVFDLMASHALQRHTLISMYDQYHLHHRFPTSMVFLLFDLWCSRRSLSLSTVLVDTLSLSRSSWYVPLSLSSSSLSFARRSCTKNRQCCEISDGAMEPEIQGIDRAASGLHLHPPALLLSLPEPVLGGFHLLPVPFPLLLPALLLVPGCWDWSLWKLASSSLCRARVRCFSCSRSTFPRWRPGRAARSVKDALCSSMWLSCCDTMAWWHHDGHRRDKSRKQVKAYFNFRPRPNTK